MVPQTKKLIADDFEATRRCFRIFLETMCHHMFMKEQPDIVLTDLQIQEMNGLAFIANLKDYIKTAPLSVICGEGGANG